MLSVLYQLSLFRKADFVHMNPLNITFHFSYTLKKSDYILINMSIFLFHLSDIFTGHY